MALVVDESHQGGGLEGEAHGVADAEGQGEEVGMRRVGEQVGRQHDDVDEEHSDDRAQEHLDEYLGRAVHGAGDNPVLQAADNSEVERQQGHDGQIVLWKHPHDDKGGQYQCQRGEEQGCEVTLHATR